MENQFYEIFLKDNGYVFIDHKDRVYRTPIKLKVKNDEKDLTISLIKHSPVRDWEIKKISEEEYSNKLYVARKLTQTRPISGVSLAFKIQN